VKYNEWDITVHELRKAVSLLLKGNPNILMLLYLPENAYIHRTDAGYALIENKVLFDGKHVYHSFVGYARGQLHRMTHGAHEGYMGHKRKALRELHGYDPKNASHMIRLLRMAIEYLTGSGLIVLREDASELIDIKTGKWTLKEVEDEAKRLFALADEAFIRSALPPKPQVKEASHLCMELVKMTVEGRGHERDALEYAPQDDVEGVREEDA
jgi:predicted nucleotidyltransferase